GLGFGWPAHFIEPIAETFEPRGESGFFVRLVRVVSWLARVVSHAYRPRKSKRPQIRRPKSRADHTDRVFASQETQRRNRRLISGANARNSSGGIVPRPTHLVRVKSDRLMLSRMWEVRMKRIALAVFGIA